MVVPSHAIVWAAFTDTLKCPRTLVANEHNPVRQTILSELKGKYRLPCYFHSITCYVEQPP